MPFERENSIFEKHRPQWLQEGHEGKFAVIKGDRVLGLFPSFEVAYEKGSSPSEMAFSSVK